MTKLSVLPSKKPAECINDIPVGTWFSYLGNLYIRKQVSYRISPPNDDGKVIEDNAMLIAVRPNITEPKATATFASIPHNASITIFKHVTITIEE